MERELDQVNATELQVSPDQKESMRLTLSNHFRVEEELGSGGMSVVYKCTDLAVQREVAVKLLQPRLASQGKWLRRFQQEAKAVGRLSHPNIVRVHHFDAAGGTPYIVMDYVAGSSLAQVLTTGGALETTRAIRIVGQIADALAHAHSKGVVHRDLKPSNIMLLNPDTAEETVKILDFGIAKINEPEMDIKLTETGEIFGSPLYMSPEQCQGKQVDDRCDQYSLGCILFECLTGYPPFTGENPMQILLKQINDRAPGLKEASLGKIFPAQLELVVQRLLSKDPGARYPSIAAAKQALAEAMTLPSVTIFAVAKRDRKKFLLGVSAALISLAALGLVTLYINNMLGSSLSTAKEESLETPLSLAYKDSGDAAVSNFLENKENSVMTRFVAKELYFNNLTNNGVEMIASKMPNLNYLSLAECGSLTAPGLSCLKKIPNLEELDLSATRLGNDAVPFFLQMKSLRKLHVNHTGIGDDGLKDLSKLPLTELGLQKTHISGDGLAHLGHMLTLRHLELADNPGISSGLTQLASLEKLEYLNLAKTTSSNDDLQALLPTPKRPVKFVHLRTVLLSNNDIGDDGLDTISKLKSVRVLHLDGTSITGKGLRHLAKMKELEDLDISRNPGIMDGLDKLADLPVLEHLELDRDGLVDDDLKALLKFKHLRKISLNGNEIGDRGMDTISQIKSIECLHLDNTKITEAGLRKLMNIKGLNDVFINGCSHLESSAIQRFQKQERPHYFINGQD